MNDKNRGWIKVYRKESTWVWSMPPIWQAIWLYFLRKARWAEGELVVRGETVHVPAGGWFGSLRLIAEDLSISRATVHKCVRFLVEKRFIGEHKQGRKGTLYVVENWDRYQRDDAFTETQTATEGGTEAGTKGGTEGGTSHKKGKEGEKKGKKRTSPSGRYPTDAPPSGDASATRTIASLVLRDGTIQPVSESDLRILSDTYPDLDCRAIVLRAAGWSKVCRPSQRWTAAGYMRGLMNWADRDRADGKNLKANRPTYQGSKPTSKGWDDRELAKARELWKEED